MRKLVIIFVAVQLIYGFQNLHAQTVDDVINKYMEALGGREKLLGIKSLFQQGVTVLPNGNEFIMKTWKVQDKLFRREMDFGARQMVSIVTDKEGWMTNIGTGDMQPMQENRLKLQQSELDCTSPLVDYAAKGYTAELLGKESADGTECYKIKLMPSTGNPVTYYIDSKNWYVVMETRTGVSMGPGQRPGSGDNIVSMRYTNYQKTADGYIFPFTMTMAGGPGGSVTFEKIEVNKPVDAKLYKPE
jgi:hypothetical protein